MGWYNDKGNDLGIVISTRVRLARNFEKYPFPPKMGSKQAAEIEKLCKDTLIHGKGAVCKELRYIDMNAVDNIEKQVMVEKHLISPEFAASNRDSAVIINKQENISIMINEEDHIRIQCIFAGLQPEAAWELSNRIDTLIGEYIDYAFDVNYGYLTSCPTNVGTGMRLSLMVHLPMLIETGHINGILETCGKVGVAVRGAYGEHSQAAGNMLQISNQVTLGLSEKEIISNLVAIAKQIIERERELRTDISTRNSDMLQDRIFRSFGILTNARLLTLQECMGLLSDVRFGCDMGIIRGIKTESINELVIITQPACLELTAGKNLNRKEQEVLRARIVREKLITKQ